MDRAKRKDELIERLQVAVRDFGLGTGGKLDNSLVVNALLEFTAMIVAGDAINVEEMTQEIVTLFPQMVAEYRSH